MNWPSSQDPDDLSTHLPDWDFKKTWYALPFSRGGNGAHEDKAEMQKLPATGKVKNIGVSNFGIKSIEILLNEPSCKAVPAVNQIQLHPNNPSPKLVAYLKEKGIHPTAYSCLGSTGFPLYKNKTLLDIAEKKGKTVQQILLG